MSRKPYQLNTPEKEAAIQQGIRSDPDNPEWTEADFAAARPAAEMVPELVRHAAPLRGSGQKPPKVQVTLRLDRDVVDGLRASGRGWQVRANQALRHLLEGQKAAAEGLQTGDGGIAHGDKGNGR